MNAMLPQGPEMPARELVVEPATPSSVAAYGHFIGVHADAPAFAAWPGVRVFGGWPVDIGSGGELLHVQMAARSLPASVELLERHPGHTQTYLSANGKPWVMVLGRATRDDGLPDIEALRAFRFDGGSGIAMHRDTWHEFPIALQDDTRFTVLLRTEAHVNTLRAPAHANDAHGPDLERWDIAARARVVVRL
jgi:ureidoglycolate lyase